ncbi:MULTISPECIES: hypothetical protein [Streptomyces]|uniref:hypothetical protein n=1 Tax=Streptomyces TaxID=1883 RepID=UPI0033BB285A
MATLRNTVFVRDPDRHVTVILRAGEEPEPRLAVLVTNPAAWVDGKLPRLPKPKTDHGRGNDQDDASGDDSDTSAATEPSEGDDSEDTKPAAKKTAARKTAASKTAAS